MGLLHARVVYGAFNFYFTKDEGNMKPTKKSPEIENMLEKMAGRTTAITNMTCVRPPIGCGKPITINSFRDEISLREYRISGLCQNCQDLIFGEPDYE